jgi:hypothetical protein
VARDLLALDETDCQQLAEIQPLQWLTAARFRRAGKNIAPANAATRPAEGRWI